jgi:two-component system, OmpR family, response regulator
MPVLDSVVVASGLRRLATSARQGRTLGGNMSLPHLQVVPPRAGGERTAADRAVPSGTDAEFASAAHGSARRVLVAVDDPVLAELVPASLRFAGYETRTAHTAAEVLAERSRLRPQLLVLDTRLRGADGVPVAQQLRRRDGHPILFLTPREVPQPRALTLTVGCDDYLATPFSLDELTARVRAILRRTGATDASPVLRYADLEFDEDTQTVRRAGTPVRLTPRERHILRHLLVNAGRIVTRAHIHDHVWPYDHTGATRSIDVHICTLRRKLDHHGPPLITTLHGTGYLLQTTERASPPAAAPGTGPMIAVDRRRPTGG